MKKIEEQFVEIMSEISSTWSKRTLLALEQKHTFFVLIEANKTSIKYRYVLQDVSWETDKNGFSLYIDDMCFQKKIVVEALDELVMTLKNKFHQDLMEAHHHFDLNYLQKISSLFLTASTRRHCLVIIKNEKAQTLYSKLPSEVEFELFNETKASA